jgi:hypothetical protein
MLQNGKAGLILQLGYSRPFAYYQYTVILRFIHRYTVKEFPSPEP